jgi:cytochrome c heme-lyase
MAPAPPPSGSHGEPGVAYNVYNQPIDPSNQMPVTPNQLPWPGQHKPLSTAREVSNIPKGGTGGRGTWVFPSPQMFFNALQRKGKGDDVVEEDMEHVISVHNSASLHAPASPAAASGAYPPFAFVACCRLRC